MRLLLVVVLVFAVTSGSALAQCGGILQPTCTPTPTPSPTPTYTPTATNTPTDEPSIHMTMPPGDGTPDGQMTRFDYTSTAGDVQISNLLTLLLYSLWGMFLLAIVGSIILVRRK